MKIQFIFKYLDRFFIPTERKNEDCREIQEIYTVALIQWHKKIFTKYENTLIDETLKYLKAEREGRRIDSKMVECVSFK